MCITCTTHWSFCCLLNHSNKNSTNWTWLFWSSFSRVPLKKYCLPFSKIVKRKNLFFKTRYYIVQFSILSVGTIIFYSFQYHDKMKTGRHLELMGLHPLLKFRDEIHYKIHMDRRKIFGGIKFLLFSYIKKETK